MQFLFDNSVDGFSLRDEHGTMHVVPCLMECGEILGMFRTDKGKYILIKCRISEAGIVLDKMTLPATIQAKVSADGAWQSLTQFGASN